MSEQKQEAFDLYEAIGKTLAGFITEWYARLKLDEVKTPHYIRGIIISPETIQELENLLIAFGYTIRSLVLSDGLQQTNKKWEDLDDFVATALNLVKTKTSETEE